MSDGKTLEQLSEEASIPARTIRYYIARGLLEGPVKAGRGAVYTQSHLTRLLEIKKLQAEGRMLAEIAHDLNRATRRQRTPAEFSQWWQHAIDDEVIVWVRGDVSPWRMKQIRAAVEQMSLQLERTKDKDSGSNR